jgi:Ice-binding-like/Bacterial Ig-like domain
LSIYNQFCDLNQLQMRIVKNVFAAVSVLMMVFLMGCDNEKDPGVRPTLVSTSPADDATNVAVNSSITATFSVAMNPSTLNTTTFTLMQDGTAVAGLVSYSGVTATFTPTNMLAESKLFTATLTTGVKNTNGDALLSDQTFSFTSGLIPDTTIPLVSVTSPVSAATNVGRNNTVTVTFSEAMNPTTISASTFTLKKGTSAVAGTVTYTGMVASFNPTNTLDAAAVYTAAITTGAKDLAGNALATNITWNFTTGGSTSSLAVVELGAAGNYLLLAKTAINNISTSALTGDLGLSPAATSYITGLSLIDATGFATSAQVTGKVYAADMADPTPINLTTAVNNMTTAYNDAAGRLSPDFLELATGNIGGRTLTPGLYKWTTSVTIPASITISGGANDVWIFQISGDLLMSNAVNMTLTGGAQAKNIFWQVAGQATFGTTSHVEGVILSMTGITFQTGASMNGIGLAQTAIVLDGNAITKPQ